MRKKNGENAEKRMQANQTGGKNRRNINEGGGK